MVNEKFDGNPIRKAILIFFILFFFVQSLPFFIFFNSSFSEGTNLFFILFSWVTYVPFISQEDGFQLYNFLLIIIISASISSYLLFKYQRDISTDLLNQLLRIIVRYKLAAVLIVYSFIKIFSLQIPYPTLSQLNTNYGDFTPAKIFELTLGIAKAKYQPAIGLAELLAAILLLFRRTATIGAIIALGIYLNVLLAAFAYTTSELLYSLFLFTISLFIISYDLPRIYNLLLERRTLANKQKLYLEHNWQKNGRLLMKGFFVLMMLFYSVSVYFHSKENLYALPKSAGLKGINGFYDVEEFSLNGLTIPYSKNSSSRWQNVVFEEWATLSLAVEKPLPIDFKWSGVKNLKDKYRNFESSGTSGRDYYAYTVDTVKKILYLENKNKQRKEEAMALSYSRPDSSTIIISGIINSKDSIYAVLKKQDKRYLLLEGRRKPIKL